MPSSEVRIAVSRQHGTSCATRPPCASAHDVAAEGTSTGVTGTDASLERVVIRQHSDRGHAVTNTVIQTFGRRVSTSPWSARRRRQSFATLALLAEGSGTPMMPSCLPPAAVQLHIYAAEGRFRRCHENPHEPSHIIERLIEEANIQISSLKTELEKMKKLGATVNVRMSTMHAVPCVLFILQTRTLCGWQWNASHVVIPLLSDIDLPPGDKACKRLCVAFQRGRHAAEGSNTGSGGPM